MQPNKCTYIIITTILFTTEESQKENAYRHGSRATSQTFYNNASIINSMNDFLQIFFNRWKDTQETIDDNNDVVLFIVRKL